jgi:hypothetical protein
MRTLSITALLPLLAGLPAFAQPAVQAPFAGTYTLVDLGVSGVQVANAALAVKFDDPNVVLISGAADTTLGAIYAVPIHRDADGHITGFTGPATRLADATQIDGGMGYGPGNVLFFGRYSTSAIGQIKPGSSTTDKFVDLAPLGPSYSPSCINFVPAGFPGAGHCKLAMYPNGWWWDLSLAPDGNGTYNITAATRNTAATTSGGPEGFAYVPLGSPFFPQPTVLMTEWGTSTIAAYSLDTSGDPIPNTRISFLANAYSVEGANFDPVSGDYLFSGYAGGHTFAVRGFSNGSAPACYANCDSSTVPPILNANDFVCFLNAYAAGSTYANCDNSTTVPVLNVNDFQCFLIQFALGCS